MLRRHARPAAPKYIGSAQYLLLRVLARCGSAYAEDLPAKARAFYGPTADLRNIYTLLKKLEIKGLVDTTIEDDFPLATRRQRRHLYKLTRHAERYIVAEALKRSGEVLVPRVKPDEDPD